MLAIRRPSSKLAPNLALKLGPLSLVLATLALAGCETMGRGAGSPQQRVAVLEEDTQGTSTVNIASLSEVIQRNPSDPGAYNTRGAAYARVGRYGDAISDFNKAVQIDPNNAPAYTNRALAFRQTGKRTTRRCRTSRARSSPIPITALPISAAATSCAPRGSTRRR